MQYFSIYENKSGWFHYLTISYEVAWQSGRLRQRDRDNADSVGMCLSGCLEGPCGRDRQGGLGLGRVLCCKQEGDRGVESVLKLQTLTNSNKSEVTK